MTTQLITTFRSDLSTPTGLCQIGLHRTQRPTLQSLRGIGCDACLVPQDPGPCDDEDSCILAGAIRDCEHYDEAPAIRIATLPGIGNVALTYDDGCTWASDNFTFDSGNGPEAHFVVLIVTGSGRHESLLLVFRVAGDELVATYTNTKDVDPLCLMTFYPKDSSPLGGERACIKPDPRLGENPTVCSGCSPSILDVIPAAIAVDVSASVAAVAGVVYETTPPPPLCLVCIEIPGSIGDHIESIGSVAADRNLAAGVSYGAPFGTSGLVPFTYTRPGCYSYLRVNHRSIPRSEMPPTCAKDPRPTFGGINHTSLVTVGLSCSPSGRPRITVVVGHYYSVLYEMTVSPNQTWGDQFTAQTIYGPHDLDAVADLTSTMSIPHASTRWMRQRWGSASPCAGQPQGYRYALISGLPAATLTPAS